MSDTAGPDPFAAIAQLRAEVFEAIAKLQQPVDKAKTVHQLQWTATEELILAARRCFMLRGEAGSLARLGDKIAQLDDVLADLQQAEGNEEAHGPANNRAAGRGA